MNILRILILNLKTRNIIVIYFKDILIFCIEKLAINKVYLDPKCPLDLEINDYDPSNVLEFINKKCNYKRTTPLKILNVF